MPTPSLDEYVWTAEFDRECQRTGIPMVPSQNSRFGGSIWSTVKVNSPYDVPEDEANLYYAGVGPKGRGPKLIYRTSKDVYEEPSGPEAYTRLMRIIPVPDSYDFGENATWDAIRNEVVVLLNKSRIKTTSVDFVRFTWLVHNEPQEIEGDEEDDVEAEEQELSYESYDDMPPASVKLIENGTRHYTNPTIWIGVVPNTLSGAVAHESAKDILALLKSLHIQNIDVAYRESVYMQMSSPGPVLFPPAEFRSPLEDIIDNVSVALSIPIASLNTTIEGTLGPYFHVGDKLYAITVRHNVFAANGDNEEYRYHDSVPKREVMVMSDPAFRSYLASIQVHISTLIGEVTNLERSITTHQSRMLNGINAATSKKMLVLYETELLKAQGKLKALKKFFVEIKKNWSEPNDRIIGFVRWAPSIDGNVPPHGYTRDICVIELYKEKFKYLKGNVLSMGPELSMLQLNLLMNGWNDKLSGWKYPYDGLLPFQGIMTADQLSNTESRDLQDHLVRRVIKRGFATDTTIGTLTGFKSFVRRYFPVGNVTQESLEVPILSHERESDSFSARGDSGSIIVTTKGEFVALLTGSTNSSTSDSPDITYGTLFEWVWELVEAEFPGADLHFDNLEEFLADVA